MDLLSLLRNLFIFSSPSLIWANFGPLHWAGGFLADVGFRYVPPTPALHLQRHHNLSHLVPNLVKTFLGKGLENVFQALTMFLAREKQKYVLWYEIHIFQPFLEQIGVKYIPPERQDNCVDCREVIVTSLIMFSSTSTSTSTSFKID